MKTYIPMTTLCLPLPVISSTNVVFDFVNLVMTLRELRLRNEETFRLTGAFLKNYINGSWMVSSSYNRDMTKLCDRK